MQASRSRDGLFSSATLLMLLALLLPGCAGLPKACPPGLTRMTSAELFFGRRETGGGFVSDADWEAFLEREVSPRFPGGFSVLDGRGQWRAVDGGMVREPSKVLRIVIKGTKEEQVRLEAIRAAYRTQFKQDSVLLTEDRECAAF